jgi:pimeloyl-ACP methyl ester carboxylesterase
VRELTFVLVHGGGTTARFWDRLVPHLSHPALPVDLPGRAGRPADPMELTVDQCVQSVVADVQAAGVTGDLVLVAHSSGGLVVPGVAAALAPRVRHIVLSAASVPPEGGTGLDCMKPKHRERVVAGMDASRKAGHVLTTPPPPDDLEPFRRSYGGEPLDDELLAFVTDPSRWALDSMNVYFQPVSWGSIAGVPVTYVKNLHDRAVPPELQDEMAARLPTATVIELDTGHIPAVTHPEAFASVLHDVAARVSA